MAHIADVRKAGGPFENVMDFAERVDLKAVGKRAIENLARAGAFDGLCASRAQAFKAADLLIRFSAQINEEKNSDQGGLFALDSAPALERPRLPEGDEWVPHDKLDEERGALGFILRSPA